MTRLIAEQVLGIPGNLKEFDRELIKKTGSCLKELALTAAGFDSADTAASNSSSEPRSLSGTGTQSCHSRENNPVNSLALNRSVVKEVYNSAATNTETPAESLANPAAHRVAVIPITTGEGTIKGFSEAVCAIADHLGFPAFITATTDLSGLAEAYQGGASIAIMADDYYYAAFNLQTRLVAGNDEATAKGYTAALQKMAGGLTGKEVVLIGAGPLGSAAAKALLKEGANLIIHDLSKANETSLAQSFNPETRKQITIGLTLEQALSRSNLLFDASSGEAFIPATLLKPDACIAAPGLPLGLNTAAARLHADRLIHDPLQIGTAVMLFQALAAPREHFFAGDICP